MSALEALQGVLWHLAARRIHSVLRIKVLQPPELNIRIKIGPKRTNRIDSASSVCGKKRETASMP